MCVFPDFQGGFHLQPVQDTACERQFVEEFERLRLSAHRSGHLPPSRAFTPLLDVPVDSFASSTVRSRSLSPSPTGSFLLTESPHSARRGHHRSPNSRENGVSQYDNSNVSPLNVTDSDGAPERGRSAVRGRCGRPRRESSPDSVSGRQVGYTEVSVRVPSQRRARTPLAEVFGTQTEKNPVTDRGSSQKLNGHSQNDHGVKRTVALPGDEYEISTLTISKAKQSLGGCSRTESVCECGPEFV